LIFSRPPTHRSTRDPRVQLLANLTIFLAVTATPMDQEGQKRHDPRVGSRGGLPAVALAKYRLLDNTGEPKSTVAQRA
jgi:hypothetical protein